MVAPRPQYAASGRAHATPRTVCVQNRRPAPFGPEVRQSRAGSLTDSTLPPSARRFASFLDRDSCAWMPSPSVALLAALITGSAPDASSCRRTRPFSSRTSVSSSGPAPLPSRLRTSTTPLRGVLRTEGLSPEQVWAVAIHRDELSTDWFCPMHGPRRPHDRAVHGSLFALAQWSPFPGTFTIVDLDAEEAFAGARLAALLTGDRTLGPGQGSSAPPPPGRGTTSSTPRPRSRLRRDGPCQAGGPGDRARRRGPGQSFRWSSRLARGRPRSPHQAVAAAAGGDPALAEAGRKSTSCSGPSITGSGSSRNRKRRPRDAEILSRARPTAAGEG